jgi:hypothetical protein
MRLSGHFSAASVCGEFLATSHAREIINQRLLAKPASGVARFSLSSECLSLTFLGLETLCAGFIDGKLRLIDLNSLKTVSESVLFPCASLETPPGISVLGYLNEGLAEEERAKLLVGTTTGRDRRGDGGTGQKAGCPPPLLA